MKRQIVLILGLSLLIHQNLGSQTHASATQLHGPIAANPLEPDYITNPMPDWEKKFHDFEFRTFEKNGRVLPYRIHQPASTETGKKYPIVFFFHGAGERGSDNRLQLFRFGTVNTFWERHPCFVVAPQCPETTGNQDGQSTWVQTGFGDPNHTMKKQPSWPMDLAMNLLD
jgi:predicted peptidase